MSVILSVWSSLFVSVGPCTSLAGISFGSRLLLFSAYFLTVISESTGDVAWRFPEAFALGVSSLILTSGE